MSSVLNAILEKGDSMDVVLSVNKDERTINAHRAILMAGSAYFETMFHGDFKEKESDKVSLGDSMEFQVLEMLVKFLYTGVLKPNKSISLERLLRAADYLQMADALEELHGLVDEELTCSNALSLWDLRNIIKCEETLAKIRSFILVNMMAIVEDISFLTIDVETITWILESDELTVNSEQDVFRWIRIWINHKYDSRLKHLPSLLRCVRYDAKMTLNFIMGDILSYCKCTESLDCVIAHLAKRANFTGESDLVVKPRPGGAGVQYRIVLSSDFS